jgi:hypothetical protein
MDRILWVGAGRVGAVSVDDGKMFRIGDQRMIRQWWDLGSSGKAIAPHSQRKPRNSENQGRNRYSPSISEPLNGSTKSAGAGRHSSTAVDPAAAVDQWKRGDVDLRSVATHSTVPTNQHLIGVNIAPRAEGGCGGETMILLWFPLRNRNRRKAHPLPTPCADLRRMRPNCTRLLYRATCHQMRLR